MGSWESAEAAAKKGELRRCRASVVFFCPSKQHSIYALQINDVRVGAARSIHVTFGVISFLGTIFPPP